MTSAVVATRGERLASSRVRASGRDPEAIQNRVLYIVEINAEDRIVAIVVFELDDFEPPSPSSMHGTSPAKRPPMRAPGRSSPVYSLRTIGTKSPRRQRMQ